MARLQFEMFLDEWSTQNRGICSTFTDGKGRSSTTWWSAPPSNIDNACSVYLKGRFWNVKTKRHVQFIKEQFKAQMQLFDEYESNRYRLKGEES